MGGDELIFVFVARQYLFCHSLPHHPHRLLPLLLKCSIKMMILRSNVVKEFVLEAGADARADVALADDQ